MTSHNEPIFPDYFQNTGVFSSFADGDIRSEEVVMDCLNMLAASVDLDTAKDAFLETLGCFYQAARAYIFEFDDAFLSVHCRAAWHTTGPVASSSLPAAFPIEDFESWLEAFETEGTLYLPKDSGTKFPVSLCRDLSLDESSSVMAAPMHGSMTFSGFLCVIDPTRYLGDMKVLLALTSLTAVELHKLRLADKVAYLDRKDPLTDTYNRRSYEQFLSQQREHPFSSTGVIIASINGLKMVNSMLGNQFGNEVVQRTAEIMKSVLSSDIYRIGGDEFLSVHPGISPDAFFDLVNALCDAFDKEPSCDVAVGYAWDDGDTDISVLAAMADEQLTDEKKSARE